MKYVERIFIAIFLIALAFAFLDLSGYALFTGISLTALAMIYFYFGFALFNKKRFREIFKKSTYQGLTVKEIGVAIFSGICLSILLVGNMFKVLNMEGATIQTNVGLVGTIISLTLAIILKNDGLRTRLIFWMVMTGIVYFI